PRRRVAHAREELAEQEGLRAETLGDGVPREELEQLVAEDRHTARLQPDHRHSRRDRWPQHVEDLSQEALRRAEHAVVVEWAAAAQRDLWQRPPLPRRLQHLDRRL